MRRFLVILIIALAISSCSQKEPNMAWLEGSWRNTSKSMDFHENWKRLDDQHLSAESYVLVKNDTVFYERIILTKTTKGWDYTVSVRDQNKELPVTFASTLLSDDLLVFENAKHDFPNRIEYKKITEDSLIATIFGTQKGKPVSEVFPMKKMQP